MKKKFNIVDLIVVLGLILLIFIFVNRKSIKTELVEGKVKRVKITCFIEEGDLTGLQAIKPGDSIFAQYKFQNGEIKSVDIKEKQDLEVGQDGKLYPVASNNKHSAWVDIETDVNFDGPYMQVGGQEVKAGINYIVKTESVAFLSEIIFMEVIDEID